MAKKKVQHHIFGPVLEVEVDDAGNTVEVAPENVVPAVASAPKKPVAVPVEEQVLDVYHQENP